MADNSNPPGDFAYTWEPVGAGYLCAFCMAHKIHPHAWRAYSEKYGQAYVCPRHLHYIQTGFRGERHAVWLAIRAAAMKSNRERYDMMQEANDGTSNR